MSTINQNLIDDFTDKINEKEKKSNKVTSWSSTTTDAHYPSEKLVKDSLDNKQDELVSGTNLKTLNGVGLLGKGDIVIDVSYRDSTIIFEDKGVTGDYNSDYTNIQSGITTTVGTTGTTLQASGVRDKFRKANALISGDFEAKYTCVNATVVYGSMRFIDSSNTNIFTVEQFGNDNVVDIDISGTTTSYPIGETITFPFTMTIRRVGNKLSVWYNDIQVATDVTVSSSDGYWAWKLYGNDGRQQTFKDFSIVEYDSGDFTAIFEDDCSVDNTSDYVNTINIGSSNTSINLTFDSSSNGYLFTGTGGEYFGGKVIPITFQDKMVVKADVKLLGSSAFNQFMLGLTDSLNPQTNGNYDMFRIRGDNKCDYLHNSGSEIWTQSNVSVYNNWVTMEITIDGLSLIGKLYDSSNALIVQVTQIINSYSNPYIFMGVNCNGNNQKYVKNIVVKTNTKLYLGDDIMAMIDAALGHMITNWEDYE